MVQSTDYKQPFWLQVLPHDLVDPSVMVVVEEVMVVVVVVVEVMVMVEETSLAGGLAH